jgi:C4-dicarboxylate-specific signal transduction histidine kinase
MRSTEAHELEELALLAELARPLAHECNNFLNNLLLQLAISENELPEAHRKDWDRVRQRGKQLGRLLQEWQRQRKSFHDGPAKTEVQTLIHELVEASRLDGGAVALTVHLPAEPLWLAASRAEAKRLYWMLLRHAIAELGAGGNEPHALEIQCAMTQAQIVFQIQEAGPGPAVLSWRDFDDATRGNNGDTLLVAACRLLAERLGGSIHRKNGSADRVAMLVSLPAVVG